MDSIAAVKLRFTETDTSVPVFLLSPIYSALTLTVPYLKRNNRNGRKVKNSKTMPKKKTSNVINIWPLPVKVSESARTFSK